MKKYSTDLVLLTPWPKCLVQVIYIYIANGGASSFWGWMKITSGLTNGEKHEIFTTAIRGGSNQPTVYNELYQLYYLHYTDDPSNCRFSLRVPRSNTQFYPEYSISKQLKQDEWVFFAVSHSSNEGLGSLVVVTLSGKVQTDFTTLYEYVLTDELVITYGGFTTASTSTSGLLGTMKELYYKNTYFPDADLLWTANYNLKDTAQTNTLLSNNLIFLQYIFDSPDSLASIPNKVAGGLDGSSNGLKEYVNNTGLLTSSTQIAINGNISPLSPFIKGLSYVFTLKASGYFTRDILIFQRGTRGTVHSLQIYISKGFTLKLVVNLDRGGTINRRVYVSTSTLPIDTFCTVAISFTTGPSYMIQTVFKIDDAVDKIFEVNVGSEFLWESKQSINALGSLDGTSLGASVVQSSFYILEGGGGLLFDKQSDPEVMSSNAVTQVQWEL